MHAVLVRAKINDGEAATEHLRNNIVPAVKQAPGLVGGYWVRLPGGDQGRAIIVFESEENAQQVSGQLQPPEDGSAEIESVDVVEVVASA